MTCREGGTYPDFQSISPTHRLQSVVVELDRILRGNSDSDGYYSSKIIGAYGSDLQALGAFFELRWKRFLADVNLGHRSFLLNDVGNCLSAVGRLAEAIEPFKESLDLSVLHLDDASVAVRYNNLSETFLMLGAINEAIANAHLAVLIADKSKNSFLRCAFRTTLAYALAHAGQWSESKVYFNDAARIQKLRQPEYQDLYSLYGFRLYETQLGAQEREFWRRLLKLSHTGSRSLALGRNQKIIKHNLSLSKRLGSKLDVALDQCLIAKISLLRDAKPTSLMETAMRSMRRAGTINFCPIVLLDSATCDAVTGDFRAARDHLSEAQHIAERGPMPLYLADVHLHRARLVGMLTPEQRAQHWAGVDPIAELATARALIDKHGYGRRREELEDAEQAAKNW